MLDFDFDIVHIPAKDNRISDFFSRLHEQINVLSQLHPVLDNQKLSVAQHADEFLGNAFDYVKAKRNFDVEKLGSVSGWGLNSNLKLIETSTPAVDPVNLIFPPFENDSG